MRHKGSQNQRISWVIQLFSLNRQGVERFFPGSVII